VSPNGEEVDACGVRGHYLRDGYCEQMGPVQEGKIEAGALECRVSDLVKAVSMASQLKNLLYAGKRPRLTCRCRRQQKYSVAAS
jgi:hypothetical protein